MSDALTLPDVARMSGASPRQIHYWVSREWLYTDRAPGSWAHLFTSYEAAVATILNRLIQAGFTPSRQTARKAREFADAGRGVPVCVGPGVWVTLTDPDED